MKNVYIVQCFDERNGGHGSILSGSRPIGGSSFIAMGVAYSSLKNAEKCRAAAKKDGLAAAILGLPICDLEEPEPKRKKKR